MSHELTVTDVTRMRAPNVCVAGVHQGRTIRLNIPPPTDEWVTSIGGLMPGDVVSVDCGPAAGPVPPHVEDGQWIRATFAKLHRLTEAELVDRLAANALAGVRQAFGAPWFCGKGGNAAFQPGTGTRSLASILTRSVRAYPDDDGIKVDFVDDGDSWTRVPLQDLIVRQHQKRCRACSQRFAQLLASEFQDGEAVLRVGLAREFPIGGHPSACWMQVNHVFLIPPKRKHFV